MNYAQVILWDQYKTLWNKKKSLIVNIYLYVNVQVLAPNLNSKTWNYIPYSYTVQIQTRGLDHAWVSFEAK